MEQQKKTYEAPEVRRTQVEVESSICSGSVDITATPGVGIERQEVNSSFEGQNNFSDDGWGSVTPNS